YTATDAYGNTVTDTATLEVVKQNAPVINGVKSEVTIEVGQAFDPLENVTATDSAGNAVEVKVTGTYDVNVPGEYTITYKAVDKYGTESAEMKTILKVVEKSNNNETPDNNGNGSGNGELTQEITEVILKTEEMTQEIMEVILETEELTQEITEVILKTEELTQEITEVIL
ncbi:immunoglobulin-like domain-containing protein, partial [Clostridium sp.]|uniref:immunoglobulin-like domain-containing protein n=1 Tax=Clostridium sp. TaxID=1506 RepID=UPI003BB5D028